MAKRGTVEPGKEPQRWQAPPQSPNCVTIFGAGVAGLTAAHELVERGFRVQIWEPVGDPRFPHRGPDIGGMARTQWARVNWPPNQSLDSFRLAEQGAGPIGTYASPIVELPQKFAFVREQEDQGAWSLNALVRSEEKEDLVEVRPAREFIDVLRQNPGRFVFRVRDLESWLGSENETIIEEAIAHLREALAAESLKGVVVPEVKYDTGLHCKLDWPEGRDAKLGISGAGAVPFSANTFGRIEWRVKPGEPSPPLIAFTLDHAWTPGQAFGLDSKGGGALRVDASRESQVLATVQEIVDTLIANDQIEYVYAEASDRDFARLDHTEVKKRAEKIAEGIRGWLAAAVGNRFEWELNPVPDVGTNIIYELDLAGDVEVQRSPGKKEQKHIERRVRFEVVLLAEFPSDVPAEMHLLLGFRVRERWLPGEHGYRLFPNCYRHLFDTMKRTPILEVVEKSPFSQEQERAAGVRVPATHRYSETGRTVFENIRPTTTHLLAFESGSGPSVLSRSKLKSLDELRQLLHIMFGPRGTGGFEVADRDALRLSLKMIQYIISCPKRREQYEAKSWWDFVDGDSYGENLGNFLEVWPEALVAMDAKSADARSHGDSLIQVTLDQFRDEGFRDGTLRGPVSEAWFRYWRRYLEAQGVEFLHGKLLGFDVNDSEGREVVWPKVECYEPRHEVDSEGQPALMPGYFVVAVSANEAKKLAVRYREATANSPELCAPAELSDLARAATFDDSDLEASEPRSDFRHFAGLQFYFAEDLFWADGHVYYPDSPWGLSSVSQARFWDERTDWEHGFRGVLSVIVASWNVPGEDTPRTAWECSPEELATEVWRQIKRAVESNRIYRRTRSNPTDSSPLPSEVHASARFGVNERLVGDKLPDPLHWRLDENLEWDPADGRYKNHAPFHIAAPDKYRHRPGDAVNGYAVENAIVMCGMHTQTFFRIPTMEAANESARHAVNAILRHANTQVGGRFRRTLCQIWDPEQFEFEGKIVDFQALKDLDDILVRRGQPHLMEILELDQFSNLIMDSTEPFFTLKTLVQLVQATILGAAKEMRHGL